MSDVSLFPAYLFDCDECGRENIVRTDPVGLERLRIVLAESTPTGGELYELFQAMDPKTVTCRYCQTQFSVSK